MMMIDTLVSFVCMMCLVFAFAFLCFVVFTLLFTIFVFVMFLFVCLFVCYVCGWLQLAFFGFILLLSFPLSERGYVFYFFVLIIF